MWRRVKVQGSKNRRRLLAPAVVAAISSLMAALPVSAQDALGGSRPSTVLPTDTAPIPIQTEKTRLGESLKLRLFQKLPAPFYFSGTVESSFRIETNVFQFPSRSAILRKFAPDGLENLSPEGAQAVQGLLDRSYAEDVVFRVSPNLTAGWALTQNTHLFVNYYCLRDKLFKNNILNTTINQVGLGIEHQRPVLKNKAQVELQFMARELWQSSAIPVFDYIPSFTFTYYLPRNSVAYFNAIMQMRSTKFMHGPNRSITPFYTFGLAKSHGRWAFSANATMLNTFQKGFEAAFNQLDTGSWICDFEVARQVIDSLPGFQAFVRCEPVFNFAGRNLPGLSGTDVRIFFGLRMSAYKPNLVGTMNMLKKHYQGEPQKQPKPKKEKNPGKNNAPANEEKKDAPAAGGGDSARNQERESDDDLRVITLNGEVIPDEQSELDKYPPLWVPEKNLKATAGKFDSATFAPTKNSALLDAIENDGTDYTSPFASGREAGPEPSTANTPPVTAWIMPSVAPTAIAPAAEVSQLNSADFASNELPPVIIQPASYIVSKPGAQETSANASQKPLVELEAKQLAMPSLDELNGKSSMTRTATPVHGYLNTSKRAETKRSQPAAGASNQKRNQPTSF